MVAVRVEVVDVAQRTIAVVRGPHPVKAGLAGLAPCAQGVVDDVLPLSHDLEHRGAVLESVGAAERGDASRTIGAGKPECFALGVVVEGTNRQSAYAMSHRRAPGAARSQSMDATGSPAR